MTHSSPIIRVVHLSSVHQIGDVRVFLKECRSLAKSGYSVTLVARGEESDTVDGVHRIAVSRVLPGGKLGRMILGSAKVLRLALGNHGDVYHFHDPELLPWGLLLSLTRRVVIYDAHENIRDQILSKPYLPSWFRPLLSRLIGTLEDLAIRRFDGVVAATPRIAETLHSPHTIVVSNFPVADEITAERLSVSRDPERAVFVGGFTEIRGAAEMIRAVELVNAKRPLKLVICGTMSASLRTAVEALPGWRFVEDLGWQPRRAAQEQMALASFGLCTYLPEPNHVEAVPNKLFEYMAAGLPVIASNFPFWEQFVTEVGSGVMVDPLNPHAIADAMEEILGDPAKAAVMGERGLAAVQDRFNWDSEARKLVAFYQSILKA